METGSPKLQSSNNFGALRLLFAVLVILAHSPQLVDGNSSREILTRIFGTLSFGRLGVEGFFLISGFLITKSFQESRSAGQFLLKRVLRIYPGFVVASLLCVFALGPFVGGQIAELSGTQVLVNMGLLCPPEMPGRVFAGTLHDMLNGSMWTIAYEFRCYLLVLAAGLVGLLSKRFIIALMTAGLLVVYAMDLPAISAMHLHMPWRLVILLGDPHASLRFAAVFWCGVLFYLYRDCIRYDWRPATLAACGLIALMFSPHLAEAAVAILGGYVLFWFAFNVKSRTLSPVGHKVDISYGVYLYAWPVLKLLIWFDPGISPWLLFIQTTATASILGWASWWLVEKPFLNLKGALVLLMMASGRKVAVR